MLGPYALGVFVILCGLAKLATWFKIGPRWLREFKIGKHTLS